MKTRNNGTRIFLIELLFSILFFIVVVAVCVQCFAQAYVMVKESEVKTQAVNVVSNAAETFLISDSTKSFTLYYDEAWRELEDADKSKYSLTGLADVNDNIVTMSFILSEVDTEEMIYNLDVKKAMPYLED